MPSVALTLTIPQDIETALPGRLPLSEVNAIVANAVESVLGGEPDAPTATGASSPAAERLFALARAVHTPADPAVPVRAPAPAPVIVQATLTRRVSRADLEDLRGWLIPRLMKSCPARNYGAVHVFLVQAAEANDTCFIRNDRAIALAAIQHRPLKPSRVAEIFCFALGFDGREGLSDEDADLASEASRSAMTLYRPMLDWAMHQGAPEMTVLENSDAREDHMRALTGRMARETRLRVLL
jgi:hypothetical protein